LFQHCELDFRLPQLRLGISFGPRAAGDLYCPASAKDDQRSVEVRVKISSASDIDDVERTRIAPVFDPAGLNRALGPPAQRVLGDDDGGGELDRGIRLRRYDQPKSL